MITVLGNDNIYLKGMADLKAFLADGSIRYSTNKLQTSNINTTLNLGSINGGVGNPILINIPDSPDMSLEITSAAFSIEGQASAVGAEIYGGGKTPFTEAVVFGANGKASISGIPVAPLGAGSTELVGTLLCVGSRTNALNMGITFTKKEDGTYEFTYAEAKEGDKACVEYYIERPETLQYEISGNPTPEILRTVISMPMYSSDVGDPTRGTHIGDLLVTIPKMQWTAETALEGSQTANTGTVLKAKALGAEDLESEMCDDPKMNLAYVTVRLNDSDWTADASKIIVLNSPLTLSASGKEALICKYISANGRMLGNLSPASKYLSFVVSEGGTYASVDAEGVVTGTTAGNAVVKVTPKEGFSDPNELSAEVEVTVE